MVCIECAPRVVQKHLPRLKITQLAEHCREGKNHTTLNIHLIGTTALKFKPFDFTHTKHGGIFFID